MLLLNFVILSLWKQHAVKQSIGNTRYFLDFLIETGMKDCSELTYLVPDNAKSSNMKYGQILLFRNNSFIPEISGNDELFARTVRLAGYTRREIVERGRIEWSLGGLMPHSIIIAKPIEMCGGRAAAGVMTEFQGIEQVISEKQSYIFVYILVNLIVLATIGFFRMRKLVIAPLEKLVGKAESFTLDTGDLLSLNSKKNEFGYIAVALHGMLTRIDKDKLRLSDTINSLEEANKQLLENQKTLVEAEKFSAIGRLSAGLAHEIGNPLGIIQGYVELLRDDSLAEEAREQYVYRALKELSRINDLIRQLLDLARKENREDLEVVAIGPVIHQLVDMIENQKKSKNVVFSIFCEDSPEKAHCSEDVLHQVLLNCLLNSLDAISEKNTNDGKIEIFCKNVIEDDTDRKVEIRIIDNGSGIQPSELSNVFEPFFTTKEVGHGTGLGLSVSRTLLENFGGSIHLKSDKGQGTCVTIRLPIE